MDKKLMKQLPLHMMLLPGIIIVLIYSYVPMAGVVIAFQQFVPSNGLFRSEWIGFENFRYVFTMPDFYLVLKNTVFIAFMKITAGLFAPIVIAILLNEISVRWVKKSFQTLVYLPHFLSWVILGGILVDLLTPSGGLVNQFLGIFGIEPVFFLGSNDWFPFVIVISDVWKEFGFGTIIYLAAITAINPSLYEAAVIDGANRWKQTWHVTLPGMLPIVVLVATLSLGNVLNAGFDQIFNLYSPIVYESGDILDTMVYRMGLVDFQYGLATAIGTFKSLVSLLFIGVSYGLAYKLANYRIF
ncbi:ABC transporter permease [Paenibacillus eucommiae]|uniref:Aldouronate transport system permease protein n=1 Tax=Paenibacillus eucommiae TaxID=1355755 RepID=A0ABS4IT54_9BACL|nr:ABC transporter permease subunit [Paenibacillus eucommiae]MBP1990754.1 putative aldouronate transport system permease protein [Paenibacillus eucommiae]